jgi:cation:H+ antiporter
VPAGDRFTAGTTVVRVPDRDSLGRGMRAVVTTTAARMKLAGRPAATGISPWMYGRLPLDAEVLRSCGRPAGPTPADVPHTTPAAPGTPADRIRGQSAHDAHRSRIPAVPGDTMRSELHSTRQLINSRPQGRLMSAVLLVAAGLAMLIVGAEVLVRGAAALAGSLGVPPVVVGLTVVSVGTSAPELAIGIDSAINDAGPLAIGNIAGTNIVNLLLILGLSAAILPLAIAVPTIRRDLPIMAVIGILLLVMCWDGTLSRVDGIILLALAVGYTILIAIQAKRDPVAVQIAEDEVPTPKGRAWIHLLLTLAGLTVIVVGADLLVRGSINLSRSFGVSEALIGLTVVAIGTSAPELVTTLVSTFRGDRDIAIGNLIGSSTYNIGLVLGGSALVAPLEVTPELSRVDLPVMTAVMLLCIPVFLTGRRMSRVEGIGFVLAYVVYLTLLITFRT